MRDVLRNILVLKVNTVGELFVAGGGRVHYMDHFVTIRIGGVWCDVIAKELTNFLESLVSCLRKEQIDYYKVDGAETDKDWWFVSTWQRDRLGQCSRLSKRLGTHCNSIPSLSLP